MGQRSFNGVNHALFKTSAAELDAPGDFDFDDTEDDEFDAAESVQRKRRHRVGSKPPWLRSVADADHDGGRRRSR